MRVLITGVSSKIANVVAERLLAEGHEVIGIDRRPWPNAPAGVEMHEVDIRKRAAEDVFRKSRPEALVHMATVTHLVERSEDRYRINLGGTRAVFAGPESVADLGAALAVIPPQAAAGFTTFCIKPSQFTDDPADVARLCREIMRRVDGMLP